MKLTEKNLLVLTIIITALIAIALSSIGFFYFEKQNGLLTKQIAELDKKIKDDKAILEKKNEIEDSLGKMKKERDDFEVLLPTKEEISYENFINTLTRLSTEADVHFSSCLYETKAASTTSQKSPFDKISYRLQADGSFYQVIYFVYLLETYQRFIKVDRFALTSIASKEDVPQYTLDVTITSYVYDKYKTKK